MTVFQNDSEAENRNLAVITVRSRKGTANPHVLFQAGTDFPPDRDAEVIEMVEEQPKRYHTLTAPSVLVGVLVLIAASLCGIWVIGGYALDLAAQRIWMGKEVFQEIPFDGKQWREYEKYRHMNVRKRMYHDLKSRRIRKGMSKGEITRLLGPPDWIRNGDYYYHLGPDAIGTDTNQLLVEFDSHGRVTRVDWVET